MILILSSIGIIMLAGVLASVYYLIDNYSYSDVDWLGDVAAWCLIIGICATFIFSVIAIPVKINEDLDYENMLDKRNSLEYQLEQIEEIPENNILLRNELYDEIYSFNARLRKIKTRADNPVWSWLYNQKIADNIDYIDIGKAGNDAS